MTDDPPSLDKFKDRKKQTDALRCRLASKRLLQDQRPSAAPSQAVDKIRLIQRDRRIVN
jgi:hypothetical protein